MRFLRFLKRLWEVLASRIRYKIAETFIVGKLFMSNQPLLDLGALYVCDD